MTRISEFFAAVRNADVEVVERSLADDPALARSRDEAGISAICTAVYFGRESVARLLAHVRDDLDIFEASTLGDADRVRELISSAPELVNAYSPDGFHPLGYACFFGRRAVFEVLLEAGANLEAPARNPTQVRPLHSAVAQSNPDTAFALAHDLLAAGASPNVGQQGDNTPLHEAAFRGHEELVRLLLEYGADPTVPNAEGKRPVDLAREAGKHDVLTLLNTAG
jgi:uncharacterized protein